MEYLFTLLYPLVAIISASAYLPQILALYRSQEKSKDIALSSWLLWIAGGLISLGYGMFCLKDLLFCLMTGLGLVFMFAIVGLVLHNRYVRFGTLADLKMALMTLFLHPVPIRHRRRLPTDPA